MFTSTDIDMEWRELKCFVSPVNPAEFSEGLN